LPDGLILSSISALPCFTGWKGGQMVFRHRVAVLPSRGLKANPVRS
jgi:hypothetical protein